MSTASAPTDDAFARRPEVMIDGPPELGPDDVRGFDSIPARTERGDSPASARNSPEKPSGIPGAIPGAFPSAIPVGRPPGMALGKAPEDPQGTLTGHPQGPIAEGNPDWSLW